MRMRRIATVVLVSTLLFFAVAFLPRLQIPDLLTTVKPTATARESGDSSTAATDELLEPCCEIALSRAKWNCYAYISAGYEHIRAWEHRYASGRMREVQLAPRDPIALDPWEADWDPSITEAKDDGSITEWDHHYYVTHNWSDYGLAILDLRPGDEVTVNGQVTRIEGVFDYPKDGMLSEVLALTGDDAIVFQTCVPGASYNRIAFGHSQ